MGLHIVLVEPEIPQNTGNIARTCAATGAILHLVGPLGFSIEDRYLKRAGLDYWKDVKLHYYNNFDEVREMHPKASFYYVSTKAKNVYSNIEYPRDSFFVFGKETKGLPEDLLRKNYDYSIRIPMKESQRSLNLANAVAVVTYEFYRQQGFEDFQIFGSLTK